MSIFYALSEALVDIIFQDGKAIDSTPGGSMLNCVVSVARLGGKTFLISELGGDELGKTVVDFLHTNGVNSDYITLYPDFPTSYSFAFLDKDKNASYIFHKTLPNQRQLKSIPTINATDIFAFGSYYAVQPAIRKLTKHTIESAKKAGALCYYDPNIRKAHNITNEVRNNLYENIGYADIVRGSHEDFKYIFGLDTPVAIYEEIKKLGCQYLIFTHHQKEITVVTPSGISSITPDILDVVSTIGAGDSFNAGIIYTILKTDKALSYWREKEWKMALTFAKEMANSCCLSHENYICTTPE